MRINGTLIGKLGGHTAKNPALVDRFIEIYKTKTKLKFYLFNSSVMHWHNSCQVLQIVDVKIDKDVNEMITAYINMFMRINNIRFHDTFTYEGVTHHYRNGIKVYEADNGTMLTDVDGKVWYHGDVGGNGEYYKDLNAWRTGKGVIYIGEYELEDLKNEVTCTLWTRDNWLNWVTYQIECNYSEHEEFNAIIACDEFIEMLAYDCLQNADWQDLSTLFNDYDYNNDWVLDNWNEYKKTHKL